MTIFFFSSPATAAVIFNNTGTFPDNNLVLLQDNNKPPAQSDTIGNPAPSVAFSTSTTGGSNEYKISDTISDFVFETDVMFTDVNACEGFSLHFRQQVGTSNNYYLKFSGRYDGGFIIIGRDPGGVNLAYITNQGWSANTWYRIKLVAQGSSLKAYVNDVLKIDVNDTTYTSGITSFTTGFYMPSGTVSWYLDNMKLSTGIIDLPSTGQTTCYDSAGAVIACAGTGQDGEIQAGVPWPDPRFTDNGDDTVTDNLTGLMWTKDGNAPGPAACSPGTYKTWQNALNYVACLNANNYLGHTDWRLPNINELRSMVHAGESNTETWLNSQGFNNVQSSYYWSSTSNANYTYYAWIVNMWTGYGGNYYKSYYNYYVWPVRSGQSGSFGSSIIQLPRTGQTTCYDSVGTVIACAGTGQDGEIQAGVPWPSPRFTDNGDATVTDNLTGLMWTKDGNAPGPAACSPATKKTWQDALNYVACLNTNSYLGYTDWRLPNVNELGSMVHDGESDTSTWLNSQGFNNVQSYYYWSSTAYAYYTNYAWIVYMWYGGVNSYNKSDFYNYYVWPVRSGQSGSLDNSILLSQATGDQQSQTVAWNDVDNEYIALWQDFRNGTGNPDIYGARLDIDGNVIATDLPIVTQTAKQAGPWVSYGGGGYIAVWIDQRNMSITGTDVYGAWILPDGTVSSEFVVTNATANQRAASVVYNPSVNNFLVTWIDDTSGTSDLNIGGAVVNSGGGVSSGPFAMITASGNQRGPYVRYDYGNSQYFMVWFDNRNGGNDIYGSRVGSSGVMLDGSGLVISNATGDQKNARLTDRRPADGISNFVLSWIDLRNGQADIYGALIDEFGTKIGSDIQIAGGSYDQRAASIDVDYRRTGQAVVIWIDKRNGTDFDIYRAQVDQSGVVSGEALVAGAATGAANNQQGPLVTYSEDNGADNGFLFLWRDNRSGVDYDLYGIKVWP